MRFSEYQTIRSRMKSVGWRDDQLDSGEPFRVFGKEYCESMQAIIQREDRWKSHHRPYFRVYPSIEKLLLSVKLDIQGSTLVKQFMDFMADVSCHSIAIEFSESSGVGGAAFVSLSTFDGNGKREAAVTVTTQLKEGPFTSVIPISDSTLEDEFKKGEEMAYEVKAPQGVSLLHRDVVRVFVGALMLADDATLIEPVVLNRDAIKYKTASMEERQIIEDRAARNKGRGWAIGKGFEEQCEVSPHFRKSHLAIFWTGKGRAVPRLQLRRGCLVKHRMPTGYHDEEESN